MKTHSGAAARFRTTKNGKLIRRKATMNHMLEKKSPAVKRRLNKNGEVAAADRQSIRRLLGL